MFDDIFSPGIEYYANEIAKNRPFSFVRYGDGEWHRIMGWRWTKRKNPVSMIPEAVAQLRATVTNCHQGHRYWPAIWHIANLKIPRRNKWQQLVAWANGNIPPVQWHDGAVWRTATERGELFVLVKAMRGVSLPVVVIGPERIGNLGQRTGIPIARHVIIPPRTAWLDRQRIEEELLAIRQPALFAFSAGPLAKILIHKLFPIKGRHSFLIDFGATWDVHCGFRSRQFHNKLSHATLLRNLTGISEDEHSYTN